jgi:hypothetical protein
MTLFPVAFWPDPGPCYCCFIFRLVQAGLFRPVLGPDLLPFSTFSLRVLTCYLPDLFHPCSLALACSPDLFST